MRAWDFTQRCSQNGGLLVVRHGYLAFERYYGRAHRNANPDMVKVVKTYSDDELQAVVDYMSRLEWPERAGKAAPKAEGHGEHDKD